MQDHFHKKAQTWDEAGSIRVEGAKKIADAITDKIDLNTDMEILDFGVGTGLLGFEIAKLTKKVYGVDVSKSMLKKLQEKNTPELHIEVFCRDIVKNPLDETFDGLISSMTLHHVEDIKEFFKTIAKNIKEDGFIAIADLEKEDGTFHSDNIGVHHFGFDKDELYAIVKDAGFKDIKIENINTIKKPKKDFGIFLLTARK